MRAARTCRILVAALAVAWAPAAPALAYQLAEGLTVNGQFFGDLTLAETNALSGFHNKRNYVIVGAQVDPKSNFHFTLDQRSEADRVFVKYAYLDRTLAQNLTARAGMIPTSYAPFDNGDFWGLRFVEQCFTQFWGALTTADLGVGVAGQVAAATQGVGAAGQAPGATQLVYDVAFTNGEGFQNTPDGKGFAVEGRLGAKANQLNVGLFLHEEANRAGVNADDPSREGLYAFWDDPRFRVGGQVMRMDEGSAGPVVFDRGDAFNVQGRVKVPVGTGTWAFGRYDWLDPSDTAPHASLLIVGAVTQVGPKIRVAPNLRSFDNGVDTENMVLVNAELVL
jgi:hypothetical protein